MGLGVRVSASFIKQMVVSKGINFMGIGETKVTILLTPFVRNIWCDDEFGCDVLEAVGRSGGIICVWDPNFPKKCGGVQRG